MKTIQRWIRRYKYAPVNGKITESTYYAKLSFMGSLGNYSMVRHRGCVPFVVSNRDVMPKGWTPNPSDDLEP